MPNVTTSAETNLIKAAQMKKVREVDFVQQFTHNSLAKLIELLGVTRKIPMMEGTTMYVYTTTGTLQSGAVGEGEIIPLSQVSRVKTAIGEITLNKWRKAASAEAIKKSGYQEAVRETDAWILKQVQAGIRTSFLNFLNGTITGASEASGTGLQAALAAAWGQLQVKFEDDTAEAVYFVNPLDVASYLGSATITVQTAFGMNYIENFLGLGTVILHSGIEQGTFIATAKQNIILYYLTMNGDVADAFSLTADETGYIGIKSGYENEERAQIESLVMSGIQFLVEYAAGVVKGTINSNIINDLTVAPETDAFGVLYDGKKASDLQSGVSVANGKVTGTLKFIEGGLDPSGIGPLSGDGYFLALKWNDPADGITSLKVGLEPSQGTGLVEAIDDTDRNGVFKVDEDNLANQRVKIVQSDAHGGRRTQYFDLSELELQES